MSIMTMDMSSSEAEQNDCPAEYYDDEVLCSGWVPTLALQQSRSQGFENKPSIPESLVNVNAEVFLLNMYIYQR